MYPSAEINGEGKPGISSGTVLTVVQQAADKHLPRGFEIDWAGISRDEVNSGGESAILFVVCLLFVYLLLSAQYESYLLPLPVILSLPCGLLGSFFFLYLFGLENNLYAQIAMLMLIGLLGKNAILIVEFATQRLREGVSPANAALLGAKARLRPILMTSFAFVAGLLPLVFDSGAGAVGNQTIGVTAAGGMLIGTLFGAIVIPGLFLLVSGRSTKS
jgi:HAE1 family hydrophobic/amphiphilic exporter-1